MDILGYFILAVLSGIVLYDMLTLWAALRASALAERRVEEMFPDYEDDDLDEPEYPAVASMEDDTTTSAHENR